MAVLMGDAQNKPEDSFAHFHRANYIQKKLKFPKDKGLKFISQVAKLWSEKKSLIVEEMTLTIK